MARLSALTQVPARQGHVAVRKTEGRGMEQGHVAVRVVALEACGSVWRV